jgi:hypothetical protein
MQKVDTVIKDMIRSACPEAPINIHEQNQSLKQLFARIQERNPRVLNRAIKDVFGELV